MSFPGSVLVSMEVCVVSSVSGCTVCESRRCPYCPIFLIHMFYSKAINIAMCMVGIRKVVMPIFCLWCIMKRLMLKIRCRLVSAVPFYVLK